MNPSQPPSKRMDSWNPLSSTSARRSASFRDVANPSKTSLYHEQTYGAPSTTSMRPKISPEQALEIEEAFYLFDIQRTGIINLRELKAAMRALGFDVRREEARKMLQSLGRDSITDITLAEFEKIMIPKMGERDSKEEIYKVFRLFDPENHGFITFRMLKSICQELNEGLSDEDIMEMITEADVDQDGQISFNEFYRIMKKRSANPLDDWDSDDD